MTGTERIESYYWVGASGIPYEYFVYASGTVQFSAVPGNYIYAARLSSGLWHPIYVGQTSNLHDRLVPSHDGWQCAQRHGVTHVHAHQNLAGESTRVREERDLIDRFQPPCNGTGRASVLNLLRSS